MDLLFDKNHMLLKAYLLNLCQRLSQLLVTLAVFCAMGGSRSVLPELFATQVYVVLGSNSMPIPGAMGVADYIMIDGFKQLVGRNAANMELLCRGMTFYGSVITSAVIILIGYIIRKKVAK